MSSLTNRQTFVYIIRIWAEYLDTTPASWRGVVVSRDTDCETPFTSLDELNDVIQQRSLSQMELNTKDPVCSSPHQKGSTLVGNSTDSGGSDG